MSSRLSRLRRVLTANWPIKLLSILLAVVSYYMIRDATGYEVEYSVPIEVEPIEGIAVLDKDRDFVTVRFRGTQDDLLKLDQTTLVVRVRPREDNPDGLPHVISISRRNVKRPPNISIVKVEPASVILTFDKEVTQTFRVIKPKTMGRPLVGNVELSYSPEHVTVRGPKRRLEEMKREGRDSITTEPVDVDGRVQSFVRRVKALPPSGTWVAEISPAEIDVRVDIVTETATREWTRVPVLAIRNPDSTAEVRIEPRTVDIAVEGPTETLQSLTDDVLRVFVDCADLEHSGTYDIPVKVHFPGSTDLNVTISPATVNVSFTED